jgi:hypothetical protein
VPSFLKKIAPLTLTLAAVSCSEVNVAQAPPLRDPATLFFPTGLALTRAPDLGGHTTLLVVSSNWDLRYSHGSLVAIDADEALDRSFTGGSTGDFGIRPLGAAKSEVAIGSNGGELRILDADTCPGYFQGKTGQVAEALVTSRADRNLYRVPIAADGTLTCADAKCGTYLSPTDDSQPHDIAIACQQGGGGGGATRSLAYVSYVASTNNHAWVTELDLADASRRVDRDITISANQPNFDPAVSASFISASPTGNLVWDPVRKRLYMTSREQTINYAPLYWFDLPAAGLASARPNISNVFDLIRGTSMRAMVLSQDRTRAFAVLPIYDANEANRSGAIYTTGAALAVLDLSPLDSTLTPNGALPRLQNLVSIDLGASELVRLPYRGGAERVAIASMDDGTLSIYDDGIGKIVKVFGFNATAVPAQVPENVSLNLLQPGNPMLGRTLWGIAAENADGRCRPFYLRDSTGKYVEDVENPDPAKKGELKKYDAPAQCDRIYVGSFAQNTVSVVEFDPASPQDAHYVGEIGNPEWP